MIHVKCGEQCLAHGECSMNVSCCRYFCPALDPDSRIRLEEVAKSTFTLSPVCPSLLMTGTLFPSP